MILDDLAEYSKVRVEEAKAESPLKEVIKTAEKAAQGTHRFREALKKEGLSFITEVKKASPSKGVIDPVFSYREIAADYERIGADCVSCLTEPKWFMGSEKIFRDIRETISIPMLRKDFTVDEYQIFEAFNMGADAVLLIVAILEKKQLKNYMQIVKSLGIDAIVEAHDEKEIETAAEAGAEIIGVNNRNLKDFSMNMDNATSLRKYIPESTLFVAESGIKTAEDIKLLHENSIDAVLIGETLMRAADRKKTFEELRRYL